MKSSKGAQLAGLVDQTDREPGRRLSPFLDPFASVASSPFHSHCLSEHWASSLSCSMLILPSSSLFLCRSEKVEVREKRDPLHTRRSRRRPLALPNVVAVSRVSPSWRVQRISGWKVRASGFRGDPGSLSARLHPPPRPNHEASCLASACVPALACSPAHAICSGAVRRHESKMESSFANVAYEGQRG